MSLTLRKLRQKGYSTEDITLAQQQQEASRRAGAVARSLREILAGEQARPRIVAAPEDLTSRQLRRRGRYGQAALLADQEALNEKDPSRAIKAREASATLKELATRPPHLEFDLFRGNVMTADQYHDVIRTRLMATDATPAERAIALAVLQEIKRWLGWQTFICTKNAAELGELLGFNKVTISDTLSLLEKIGAMTRAKQGRVKIITVTPEGAFRGDLNQHAELMDQYKSEVIPLRDILRSETLKTV